MFFDIIVSFQKNKFKRFNIKETIKGENALNKNIKNIINSNITLKKINKKYINKLCLINALNSGENERKIENFILLILFTSSIISLLSLNVFSIWYMIIFSFFFCGFLVLYIGTMYVNIKLNKVYSYFPLAIQLFTDEYVSYKNIKIALNKSYHRMPNRISKAFESLTRNMSSASTEDEYKDAIKNFAEGLDFTWGYSFSEILLLSYSGAGDITEDLIYLSELTSEEIKENLESEAALNGTKLVFIVLNIATIVAFILNLIFVPMSKHLYFYTSTGNIGISAWLGSIVLGLATLSIFKHI